MIFSGGHGVGSCKQMYMLLEKWLLLLTAGDMSATDFT